MVVVVVEFNLVKAETLTSLAAGIADLAVLKAYIVSCRMCCR